MHGPLIYYVMSAAIIALIVLVSWVVADWLVTLWQHWRSRQ
jgi:hypothetical protein